MQVTGWSVEAWNSIIIAFLMLSFIASESNEGKLTLPQIQ